MAQPATGSSFSEPTGTRAWSRIWEATSIVVMTQTPIPTRSTFLLAARDSATRNTAAGRGSDGSGLVWGPATLGGSHTTPASQSA